MTSRMILSAFAGLILGFLSAFIYFSIPTIEVLGDGWTVHPSGTGTRPTFVPGPGHSDKWVIGRQNNSDGAAGSAISKKFDCGDNPDRYCTITFSIHGSTVAQGEQPYVELTSGGTTLKKRIPSSNPAAVKTYQISVKGCSPNAEIRFGIDGRTDTASIGSAVNLISVNSKCLIGKHTSGTLMDMRDAPEN